MGILNTICKGLFETIKLWVILGIQTLFACKTPKPLNQIQVRRIGWQKQKFDVPTVGMLKHQFAFLITGIVQHNSNRLTCIFGGDFREQKRQTLSALMYVSFVIVKISFVTASTAPSTLKRCRPAGEAINKRVKHQTVDR